MIVAVRLLHSPSLPHWDVNRSEIGARPSRYHAIRVHMTCRWLSIAYMTWAQLGLRHPLSTAEEGWAWVDIGQGSEQGSAVAAHGTSSFVARTLVQLEQAEGGAESSGSQSRGDHAEADQAAGEQAGKEQAAVSDTGEDQAAGEQGGHEDDDDRATGDQARASIERTLASLAQRNKQIGTIPCRVFGYRTPGCSGGNMACAADTLWLAGRLAQVRTDAIQRLISEGHVTTKIADPELARSSSAMAYMMQQSSVVKLAKQAVSSLS